jgi:hypothetical protein
MDFYLKLPAISMFRDVTKIDNYTSVPKDWSVIITDVVNSTVAISQGRYKEVNTAGALSIAALANQKLHTRVPFIFGGDGVTMLCPPEFISQMKDILHGTRNFVKENFDLDLRIGIVKAEEIINAGFSLLAGKFSEIKPFQQAIFIGEGFDYAEKLVKGPDKNYLLPEDHIASIKPDYNGYSCPFIAVKSENGVVLSLIVKKGRESVSYENSVNELLDLLGNEKEYYPVSFNNLYMAKKPSDLYTWSTVYAGKNKGFRFKMFRLIFTLVTKSFNRKIKASQREASAYVPLFTDHRKFDGSLKMVISCTAEKAGIVKDWLEKKESGGEILYGLHESDSSLITCLFDGKKDERELHLIDGSNGGYTLAAKGLKKKIEKVTQKG